MENFNILEKKENLLFNRKEIKADVESEITPSRKDIKELISEKLSTSPENIKIKNILGKFGSKIFRITANIYASEQDKDNVEPKSKRDSRENQTPVDEKPVEETKEPIESDNKLNQLNEASEDKAE